MGRLSLDLDTTAGTSFIDDSDWAFAYQLGAGIAFDLSANFALDIGYRYKVIKDAELETETAGPGAGAELEVDYKSHNVVAGIRLSF
jgi:opacity protein-like surface antigen